MTFAKTLAAVIIANGALLAAVLYIFTAPPEPSPTCDWTAAKIREIQK